MCGELTEGLGAGDAAAIAAAADAALARGPRDGGGLDALHGLLALRALRVAPSEAALRGACAAAAGDLAAGAAAGKVMAAKEALAAVGALDAAAGACGGEALSEAAAEAVARAVRWPRVLSASQPPRRRAV